MKEPDNIPAQEVKRELESLCPRNATVSLWIWLPITLLYVVAEVGDHHARWTETVRAVFLGFIITALISHYVLRRRIRSILAHWFPARKEPSPPKPKCGQCGIDLPDGRLRCRFCGWEAAADENAKQG